ncbi:MAG: lysophospholipid acyltransferase family protein [Alphaproteobacteria bacterium]|nr:lysophospholipid acyltransferase family protein [Alphaproteobacteria bacterium]
MNAVQARPETPAPDSYRRPRAAPQPGFFKTSRLLGALRATGIGLWTLWLALLNLRSILAKRGVSPSVTLKWHKMTQRIAAIDVRVIGAPIRDRPVLFVANHASYLDIVVLGALLPCSFVSKSEVRDWPIFGWLAVQQRTVFIERDPRKADRHLSEMKQRIEDGGCLVLFPEGTSSDGSRVLPFKSALFQSASIEFPETGQIEVQTVSIAYNRLDGMPMGRALRPLYTWFGDMELVPHLLGWLGLGTVGVDVVFHEPLRMNDVGGRKELAMVTQRACAEGLQSALRNAPQPVNPMAEHICDP